MKLDDPISTPAPAGSLSESELKLLQVLVYQECGLHFDERRTHFLQDRLLRRMRACQTQSFYSYYRLLTSSEGKREMSVLLENLAIHETSFFRNKAQFDLFHKVIMEELLQRKQERRDCNLRVWSAGCSTGQEAYTIAMLMCDALSYYYLRNFFFQAEDGIRDLYVTGVQTCALPILPTYQQEEAAAGTLLPSDVTFINPSWMWAAGGAISTASDLATYVEAMVGDSDVLLDKIGRASCRERV